MDRTGWTLSTIIGFIFVISLPAGHGLLDCDFQSGFCSYVQLKDDNFDWSRLKGPTSSIDTGPSVDHTQGDVNGYYAYIETSSGSTGYKARLQSAVISKDDKYCVEFYYHMYGSSIDTLNVYQQTKSLGTPIWTKTGDMGDRWNLAQVAMKTTGTTYIVYEAVRGTSFTGDIAIDDVGVVSGSCPIRGIDDCDFQSSNLCGYTQAIDDDFNWSQRMGSTPSAGTGPSIDSTYGTAFGNYMYTEATNKTAGMTARLNSISINPATWGQNLCWSFNYHMYGTDIGTLNVRVLGGKGQLWSRSGDIGNSWYIGQFSTSSSSSYQIVFEAVMTGGDRGDIAIDDVGFVTGKCGTVEGSCDFETDKCVWTNSLYDDFDWTRHTGLTATGSTGPGIDHTTGTAAGYYLYTEANSATYFGEFALLVSPPFDDSFNYSCVSFWYNMYGTDIGSLRVYTTRDLTNPTQITELLWGSFGQSSANQNQWFQGTVPLNTSDIYRIEFKGERGSGSYGDLAIDDITLQLQECDLFPLEADPADFLTFDCDFEASLCGWTQDSNDDFDWLLDRLGTPSTFTGPTDDHSKVGSGHYIYTESNSPQVTGDRASLNSPLMSADPDGLICFYFWYHMYGQTMGTLRVYLTTGEGTGTKTLVWLDNADRGNEWIQGFYQVQTGTNWMISIEGETGGPTYSDMAVDDTSYVIGECPQLEFCHFELDFCEWYQESVYDDFNWQRSKGALTGAVGAPTDRTTNTAEGYFAYIDPTSQTDGDAAILYSYNLTTVGIDHCLTFWYLYSGAGALQVLWRYPNALDMHLLWQEPSSTGNQWMYDTVTFTPPDVVQVVFRAVVGNTPDARLAIDEVHLGIGSCASPVDCTFDDGYCGWQQDSADNFDWTRNSGGTPSGGTGPPTDHTPGAQLGFYLFIESSSENEGEEARLYSSPLRASISSCFELWYHMYGEGTGTLNVYIERVTSGSRTLVFTQTGDQGNVWLQAQMDLKSSTDFFIVIEAVEGVGYLSDIAIDDTRMYDYLCSSPPVTNPPTLPPVYVVGFMDCNFEGNSLCLWSQVTADDFDWSLTTGASDTIGTGPPADHTKQNQDGFYAHIDVSGQSSEAVARLISPLVAMDGLNYTDSCIEFWYHMYGPHVNKLNVKITDDPVDFNSSAIWSKSSSQGYEWFYEQIQITSRTNDFYYVFEGYAGVSYQGDIALDDIVVLNGTCPGRKVCDFETDWCGYVNYNPLSSLYLFDRGTPDDNPQLNIPMDHTYSTGYGHYLFVEPSTTSNDTNYALVVSPRYPIPPGTAIIEISMWTIEEPDKSIAFAGVAYDGATSRSARSAPEMMDMQQKGSGPSVSEANMWFHRVTYFVPTGDITGFYLYIYGYFISPFGASPVAIDDVQVIPTDAASYIYFCTFETSACSWENSQTDDEFDWFRSSGGTATFGTGPTVDNTLGTPSGWYMFVDGSHQSPGDRARLQSTMNYAPPVEYCISFYYHMYGEDVGSLTLYLETLTRSFTLWSLSGDQGDQWLYAMAPYYPPDDFRLVFEAVTGAGINSDIAIDDVYYLTACIYPTPPPRFDCQAENTTELIAARQVCDWSIDCSTGLDEMMCMPNSFEDGLGRYEVIPYFLYPWITTTATDGVGPSQDWSGNSTDGTYMMVDTTNPYPAGAPIALLASPEIQQAYGSLCQISFWYYISGDAGKLRVGFSPTDNFYEQTVIARLYGDQGTNWKQAVVNLNRIAKPFQLGFEAVPLLGKGEIIAIDEIGESDLASCGPPARQTSCPPEQFRCSTGVCVTQDKVCDFTDDCGDFSDEVACSSVDDLRCSFESGLCRFSQVTNGQDDADWLLTSGRVIDNVDRSAPTRDHTRNEIGGQFVLFDQTQPGVDVLTTAWLVSPTVTPGDDCTLKFWFYAWGDEAAELNVYYRQDYNGPFNKLSSFGQAKDYDFWQDVTIDLQWSEKGQVLFEAVGASGPDGSVALDDIVMLGTCAYSSDDIPGTPTTPSPVTGSTPAPECLQDWYICPKNPEICVTPSQRCNFYDNCPGGEDEASCGQCEYDNGDLCGAESVSGWVEVPADFYPFYPTTDANQSPSAKGNYLATFVSYSSLTTPWLGPSGKLCQFEFDYYMTGEPGSLQVSLIVDGSSSSILMRVDGDQGDTWYHAVFGLDDIRSRFQIQIVNQRFESDTAQVAIDKLNYVTCDTGSTVPSSDANCTFEVGTCGYYQLKDDDFDWTRHKGTTSSIDTGPTTDHTTGTGYYMFIETSSPNLNYWVARLALHPQRPTDDDGLCLIFYYHMYGDTIDTLNVILVLGTQEEVIFSQSQSQGNRWRKGVTHISTTSGWQVIFEAKRGTSFTGDIAIDDVFYFPGACPSTSSCSFESGLCSWSQDGLDDFDWSSGGNGVLDAGTGPPTDYTTNTIYGTFLYAYNQPPRTAGEKARLFSPLYQESTGSMCLTFYYIVYGNQVGALSVSYYDVIVDQMYGPLWEKFGTVDSSWRKGLATVSSTHPYQIVIEALIGSSSTGSIAVDELTMTQGACPREGFCDFEDDLCIWSNAATGDNFDWIQNSGPTSTTSTGPSIDHTYSTVLGSYVYLESSSGSTGWKARLESPYYPASNGQFSCLTFWYHMYGATTGSLRVLIRDEDNKITELWVMSGNMGDIWLQGQTNLYNEKEYQVIIEGIRGTSSSGDIAIDDVDINTDVCDSPPTGNSDMDCTFESGFCSFVQDDTDEQAWLVGVDPYGPTYDRTYGTTAGNYAYIDMNTTSSGGDRARMIGPLQVPYSTGSCLTFWYHMSGSSIDRLAVYVRQGTTDTLVFTRSGAQGDQWIRGQKNIVADTAWQAIFEGRFNTRNVGHIAVDDIVLGLTSCSADYECTFETGFCGWTQGVNDNLDWTLFKGLTPSSPTGPDFDHTTGTAQGYYIYLESSTGTTGYNADLFSPTYAYTDGDCFTMWYHMYGSTMGTLNVYVKDLLTQEQTKVFAKSGINANEWRYATMSVSARHNFQMRLEAIRGNNYYSDMAVDDISMTPGACSGRPGFCDFETSYCAWVNEDSDKWDWDRTRGREGEVGNPATDHTTETNQGFYLSFLIVPPKVVNGDSATLISESLQPVKEACFQMWYHMTGTATGTLKVLAKTTSTTFTLTTLTGDAGNVWRFLPLSLTQDKEFRLYLEATSTSSSGIGHIAIDDVDVEPASCASLTTLAPTTTPPTQGPTQAVGIYDCTFEVDFCQWIQDDTDQAEWERTIGTTFSSDTGPIGDHTTGGLLGAFIHVDSSGTYNQNARISLREMTTGPDGNCVRFWYNMFGADVNTLNMIKREGAVDTVMWTKTGNQGQAWLLGQVHLTGTFEVFFEVITGNGNEGDISLDDIFIWDSQCPVPDICDFEEGPDACEITQDGTDEFDWYWSNGAAGTKKDRPDKDKTTGTDQGYYYLFNATTETLFRSNEASFFSKTIAAGEFCLQFWFRTGGFNAKVEISIELNGNTIPVGSFNKYEDSNERWHLGQLKLMYGMDYKLRFKGLLNVDDDYVAIDDINFSVLTCSDLANTDFERDYGTYVNVQGDDFDWIRQAGSTPNQNSGPSEDHTLGTEFGYYAFIDTSPPRTEGEVAWLVSDTNVDVGRPFCMSMWYHMYGATPGTLTLYQRASEETRYDDWRFIQSWSGDKGDYWNHGLVDISAASPLIQVVFEGMVGEGNEGDIAIDDIMLFTGECVAPTNPPCVFLCDGGQFCLNEYSQICNFVEDCSDGTDEALCGACDFETGLCGLVELSTGSYQWTNGSGATPTDNTGPTVDHTLGTDQGSYLYVDADSGSGFSKAVLRTPDLYDSSPSCLLTTWVHIQGSDIGELGIYITRESLKTLLLLIPDPLGSEWVQIQVGVGRIAGKFQIQFEAVRSFSILGDIAIDDIQFSGCSFPPPEGVCREGQFRCDSRGCIDESRICDLSDDCGDYSDETNCGEYVQCTFENSLCTWQQLDNDELDWYWISGGTPTGWTGPERDHTTGLSTGHYLYLESSAPRRPGDRARLGSTNFRATTTDCQLRFYYHMFGADTGSLNVYKRTAINGRLQLLWSRSGNIGDFFERADIVLGNSTTYDVFQVIIEATVGDGIYGDIAIDDISFTDACDLRNTTQLPEVTTVPPVSGFTTQRACQSDDFLCSNGFCIPLENRCDGTTQCVDGSDELECGDCTFENDQCGWMAVPSGLYTWVRQIARDAPASIAPGNDHTTGGTAGYYMYVDQTQGTFGLTAVLQSPYVLGNTGTRCQIEYWYHLYGGDAGALVINVIENYVTVATQAYIGTQGNQWNQGILDIGARAASQYYIRFEATPGGGLGDPNTVADIALDDISFINCGSSADISCDFGTANAMTKCGWTQDKDTDDFNWSLRSGGTPTYYTGPKGDHTTEGSGPEDYGTEAYLYAEVSSGSWGDNCRLLSGSLKPTSNEGYCFSFWYHMYGSTIGEFNIYIKTVNGEQLLFHKRGTQEFKWLQGYRTIQSANSFEIIIEAVRGGGFEGDIAIDDLDYQPAPCPPPVECEFESDFCEWINVEDDSPGFDWERGKNGDPGLGTGPPVDHSSESSTAYFAFANVAAMPELSEARLASPLFDRSGVQCLTFFYNVYGADIGTLFVYKQDEGDNFVSPSFERTGDQGQYWRQAQMEVYPTTGSRFRLYFEAIAGSSLQGNMAIDDVSLLPGLCPLTDFCDFERSLCTWQNDYQNDNFDWVRDGAGTGSAGTGPEVDHTLNSKRGYYMYIEASGKTVGDKAWFVSDRIPPTAGRCFDFWYHMYGSAIETLSLYRQNVNQVSATQLWTKTGNYGNVWLNAKVPLSETNEFWVFFEGLIGANSSSDIALDDLHIQSSPCSTTPAPPTTTTPAPTYAPDSHDCDFQQNLCLWSQDKTENLDWTRKAGTTSSVDTGPGYDHTYGNANGYYIYLETSSGVAGDMARILSSQLFVANGTQYCLEFWHHMYGINIDSLNVYIRQGADVLYWTKQGDQGDVWLQAMVNIPVTGTYLVVFEATRGASYQGDIALDDIRFYPGKCPPTVLCDFEFDQCDYQPSPANDFDWNRVQAGASQTSLATDHSTGTQIGHYMYADFTGQASTAKAAIISAEFPATTGSCLNFYFAPIGDLDAGTLTVIRRGISGTENVIWSSLIGRLHNWHLATATVTSAKPGEKYLLVFEANRDSGSSPGGVAIDDIETQPGICTATAINCDFESRTVCGWEQLQNDDFDWAVISGTTTSTNTGPSKDHTLNSADGHYAFIESSTPQVSGDFARLLSPIFSGYQNRCLEFFYHMYGTDSGDLTVYQRVEDFSEVTLFSQSDNKGDIWRKGQVTLDDTIQVYDLIIEATVGSGFSGDIAIDDTRVFDGICPDVSDSCEFFCGTDDICVARTKVCNFINDCPNLSDEDTCGYSCQFESDFCGWTSETTGVFKWARGRGQLPEQNGGPYIDHTTLSSLGYYIYITSNSGSLSWASLTSPKLHDTATSCEIQFWALLSGDGVGYIDVVILNDYSGWSALKITSETGENVWEKQTVRIGRNSGALQISIRASRTFAVTGAIAVDDILFSACDLPVAGPSCQPSEFECDNSVCVSDDRRCDYNDDCGDYSEEDDDDCPNYLRCNFENGMCEYTNLDSDNLDWTRASGSDTTPMPPSDHTLLRPGGSFVYVGDAPANANTAHLGGPVFQGNPTGSCTMRLWFYNYGSSPGSLQIGYRTGTDGPVWVLADILGPVGNYWERYQLSVSSAFDFQTIIVAVQNFGVRSGVIAVDDITYTDGCVPTSGTLPVNPPDGGTTVSPCGVDKWRCANAGCIDRAQVCDYSDDCGDGSDEANCGQCDFEVDFCGYTDKSLGNHAWTRTALLARAAADGYYIRVDTGTGVFNEPAILQSALLPVTSPKCVLQFSYQYQATDPSSSFNVVIVKADDITDRTIVWYPTGTATEWTQATVSFGRQSSDFYLQFEGSLYLDTEYLNLDAITLTDCKSESYEPCDVQCDNALCVPKALQCDYSDDCGDRTDERNCDDYVERCDFEDGLCNWNQIDDDGMDWAWISAKNGKQGGAPGWDHTTISAEGSYLYLYSLSGDKGKTAHISSMVFMPSDCKMRFWYHMYGVNVNRLSVLTRTSAQGSYQQQWTLQGSQGDGWYLAEVTMSDNDKFQVVIEATAGLSSTDSDHIAIDDVSFTPGCLLDPDNALPISISPTPSISCNPGFSLCRSDLSCISNDLFCDFKFDCDDGTDEEACPTVCNFEDGLCNWYQDTNDDIDWQVYNSDTTVGINSPISDHTTNNPKGQYIYVDGSQTSYSQMAGLISPVYGQTGSTCSMSFWYYQYGSEYGGLGVFLSPTAGGEDRLLARVYRVSGQTDKWIRQDVFLPVCVSKFQIILDVVNIQSTPKSGGIAVDDIRFDTCQSALAVPSCASGYSQCNTGECYASEGRCDFTQNCCSDSSDETGCSSYEMCNFDLDMCTWTNAFANEAADDVDWTRRNAGTTGGPSYDHTTDSSNGYYAIMGNQGSTAGDRAQLRSYVIDPVSSDCYLRMYVYLGDISSSVAVYTRTQVGGPLTFVWGTTGSDQVTGTWMKYQVPLSSAQIFQVIVEATRGSGSEGAIALDDTSFTPACDASASPLPSPSTESPRTRPPQTTRRSSEIPNTPQPHTGPSSGVIIGVSIACGFFVVLFGGLLLWKFMQRRQDRKADFPSGIGNPSYGDQPMSDFKMESADSFPDDDGIPNDGFVDFGTDA